jgi:L-malate glycosyltransferase
VESVKFYRVVQTGRVLSGPDPPAPRGRPASVDCRIPSINRTRILYVVTSLDVGGTETQMVQMAQRLDPRRYDVTVATLGAGGPLTEALQTAGIRILEVPKRRTMLSFRAACQLIRMAWFIRREKIDVVHAHDLWGNLMAVPAAWLARAPVIISSQRNLATLSWYTPSRKKIIRRVHLLATFVIANSEASRRLLIEEFRIPSERVRVLYNGVDFERIAEVRCDRRELFPGLASNARLILNVANMNSNVKGQSVLIEAAKCVCTDVPEARFILVGDGPLRMQFEEQVRSLGIMDHFLFLGSRRDVPKILSCGDLFVLSSFAEGLPNAVLEASAAGLPIVATAVGGIPEIIEDRVTGLLVPPKNPQALSVALLQLLKDSAFAAALAHAGKERVSTKFCFDNVLAQLRVLYGLRSN